MIESNRPAAPDPRSSFDEFKRYLWYQGLPFARRYAIGISVGAVAVLVGTFALLVTAPTAREGLWLAFGSEEANKLKQKITTLEEKDRNANWLGTKQIAELERQTARVDSLTAQLNDALRKQQQSEQELRQERNFSGETKKQLDELNVLVIQRANEIERLKKRIAELEEQAKGPTATAGLQPSKASQKSSPELEAINRWLTSLGLPSLYSGEAASVRDPRARLVLEGDRSFLRFSRTDHFYTARVGFDDKKVSEVLVQLQPKGRFSFPGLENEALFSAISNYCVQQRLEAMQYIAREIGRTIPSTTSAPIDIGLSLRSPGSVLFGATNFGFAQADVSLYSTVMYEDITRRTGSARPERLIGTTDSYYLYSEFNCGAWIYAKAGMLNFK